MGTVSLHAVGIDEVRDAFSGTDAALARLRSLAAATWPQPTPPGRPGNLLGKLGPFSRRGIGAPVVRPGVPTGQEVEDIAHGRELPPDRLDAAWALLGVWLDATSWGQESLRLTDKELDDLDFALACAGVESRYGLRRLFNDEVRIPLKLPPGHAMGYVRGGRAEAMASAWEAALPALDGRHRALASPVAAWLGRFAGWEREAAASGRPPPDLVVSYEPDVTPAAR